jgi:hypothetical protein
MRLGTAINPRVLLLPALIALGACANTSSPMHVAADNGAQNGTNSVSAVSDALGQRLDAMVTARQTGGSTSR